MPLLHYIQEWKGIHNSRHMASIKLQKKLKITPPADTLSALDQAPK